MATDYFRLLGTVGCVRYSKSCRTVNQDRNKLQGYAKRHVEMMCLKLT
jgi:hypothetical protein